MKQHRQLFDLQECLEERKEKRTDFINHRDEKLRATIRIAGAPELSRFRVRVVLNDCIEGRPLEEAVKRALAIVDKKPATK